MNFINIINKAQYDNYIENIKNNELIARNEYENGLIDSGAREFSLQGYCKVCQAATKFHVDYQYHFKEDDKELINWRERLVCWECQLNNRVRASINLFLSELKPNKGSSIYVTEQTTDLFKWVKSNYPATEGSEYLGWDKKSGDVFSGGIRHEDLTCLSFATGTFDYILSFDVFEHIPNYRLAIKECFRVLKPGGKILFTIPFQMQSDENIVRAVINEKGNLEHILEPEYHGNPVDPSGCLCFYHFGWNILKEFKDSGFSSSSARVYWSKYYGYLGGNQIQFIAEKN
jgi:hypothetical protein